MAFDPERVDEFAAYLLPWTLARTKREVREACQEYGVLGAPISTVAEALDDPSFVERGFFQQIDHPETGAIRYPGYHFTLHSEDGPMPPRRRAPLLGEHTDEILGALPERRPAGRRGEDRLGDRLPLEGHAHPRLHRGVGGALRHDAARRLGRGGDPRRVPAALRAEHARLHRPHAARAGGRQSGARIVVSRRRAGGRGVEPQRTVQRARTRQALDDARPHAPRGPGAVRAAGRHGRRPDREQPAAEHREARHHVGSGCRASTPGSCWCACRRSA